MRFKASECDKKTELQPRRRPFASFCIFCEKCDLAPRTCATRLSRVPPSVPPDVLWLSCTALRARTRRCAFRPTPASDTAALARKQKTPLGRVRTCMHTHTEPFGRRRSRQPPVPTPRSRRSCRRGPRRGQSRSESSTQGAVEKTTYSGATIHHIAFFAFGYFGRRSRLSRAGERVTRYVEIQTTLAHTHATRMLLLSTRMLAHLARGRRERTVL